jgi:hypothetical protein
MGGDEPYYSNKQPFLAMQGLTAAGTVSPRAIVFLNGEYWGVHNLQEAYEKEYFPHHHPGVDANAIDYLEGYASGAFAYEGDSSRFDALISFLQTNDLSQATNYAIVQSMMEVDMPSGCNGASGPPTPFATWSMRLASPSNMRAIPFPSIPRPSAHSRCRLRP